jgi:type III restriction enzyme
MSPGSELSVLNGKVRVQRIEREDFISLTDIAKHKNPDDPRFVIQNWMRTRPSIEFLGLWEVLNNPEFNRVEFDTVKNASGSNAFVMTPTKWIELTGAVGIQSKAGRYGGTYAHKDIAFEFASWVSVEFKLYLIKEFQRLQEAEQKQLGWDVKRNLAKINYRIHTDAIQANLIPPELSAKEVGLVYANEADVLNMALFGMTARQWRDANPGTKGNVRVSRSTGNIFLTNIHRVYAGNEIVPSAGDDDTMDYFLGKRPTGETTDSKVDLGMIVRDIDELMVLNDEAHHVHDSKLAWFQSIQDIHHRLVQKGGNLSLQVDVTATPKHNNGAIFVQTVADYPLVEAICQNVVKHPVLPDSVSRGRMKERPSAKFTEKYADYLNLGMIEWRKAYEEHQKMGKKAILFVMTDDTRNCDEVAEYLETCYPELGGAVLAIHTNNNGDISEAASGKNKEELEALRQQANEIDSNDSPYKVIVSVLMLKEGWDVRNVTTIVGLRAYSSKSNVLPEQTLGRGLRKMYPGDSEEFVSVVGTDAFMEFVESIRLEGVDLERREMGEGTKGITPVVIEVDRESREKDMEKLDIEIPVLTPRVYREYKSLAELNLDLISVQPIALVQFSEEEQREIVFKEITNGEITHTTELDAAAIGDHRSVLAYFTRTIMKELRLISGYEVLYPKVKVFVRDRVFGEEVDLDDPNILRNLSELPVTVTVLETFKLAINDLTVKDRGDAEIRDTIKLRNTRPFVVKNQEYLVPKKSVFNKVVGDSHFELEFAAFLEACPDVVSYAKNFLAVHFKLDYVNEDGDISNYYPDFMVKLSDGRVVIVETKGLADLDVPHKMRRLKQWCEDTNRIQNKTRFDFVYVDDDGFKKHKPNGFTELMAIFKKYREQD